MSPQRDKRTWIAPPIWKGGECFIIGGGPSLRGFDIDRLKGRRVIAVNQAYKLAPWIDVMFFGDCRWLASNAAALLHFAGLKVTTCEQHIGKPGITVIKRLNRISGISIDPGILAWNLSSGACVINLAVHFGVKRIILLGYDMQVVDGNHNWHDDYAKHNNPRRNPYPRFMRNFPAIAEGLKRKNIECLNACPTSALDVFPKVKLEDVL